MDKKPVFLSGFFSLSAPTLFLLVFPNLVEANYIGADPPYCCRCANRGPFTEVSDGSGISLTEGNLSYHGVPCIAAHVVSAVA